MTKSTGFYEVQVFLERWPSGPADYLNAVVEFIRPWPSSPLMPRHHEGWIDVYEWHPAVPGNGLDAGPKPARWVMWSVHRDRVGPMKLGTKVDPPE